MVIVSSGERSALADRLKAEGYDVIRLPRSRFHFAVFLFALRQLMKRSPFHLIGPARPWPLRLVPFLIASWTQIEKNCEDDLSNAHLEDPELDRRLDLLAEQDLAQRKGRSAQPGTFFKQGQKPHDKADSQPSKTSEPQSEFDRLLTSSHP
jgi:hypothetical protein